MPCHDSDEWGDFSEDGELQGDPAIIQFICVLLSFFFDVMRPRSLSVRVGVTGEGASMWLNSLGRTMARAVPARIRKVSTQTGREV
jgi:hypothetical protein